MHIALAIGQYIDWKSTYTKKAFLDYPRALNRFQEVVDKPLEKIGPQDLALFQRHLKKVLHLSDNTIAQHLIVIKNFFSFWKAQGKQVMNPALIRVNKNFTVNSHNALSPEEWEKGDQSFGSSYADLQKRCAHHLLWFTGVRVSELLDLRVAQVQGKTRCEIKNKKNSDIRWIFWPKKTMHLLEEYIKVKNLISPGPYLFVANSPNCSDRLTEKSVQRWIKDICHRVGITRKISPHSYRHGFSHLRKGEVVVLSKLLGHRNIASTSHYLKLGPNEIESTAKKFFSLLALVNLIAFFIQEVMM